MPCRDAAVERLYEALKLVAENDGDAYRERDPKAAVHRAYLAHRAAVLEELRYGFGCVASELERDLADRWAALD